MPLLEKSFHASSALRRGVARVRRGMATNRKEGDISNAFVSLSGAKFEPLPDRFRQLKCDLIRGRETRVVDSWTRLLRQLRRENKLIAEKGPAIVPQLDFADLDNGCSEYIKDEVRKRGAVVIRGVVPEAEARAYKDEVEAYVKKNPWTKAFPQDNPQVYELYWSAPQLKARGHPNLLRVQERLMSMLWHTSSPDAQISLTNPVTYADRLRIRQPGDATFALGPHIDGGSIERWEPQGYGRGGVYDKVFQGQWESYDPWDASGRVQAVTDLYDGLGGCSMFRMWQGWLSMSRCGPREGTLLVNPLLQLSTSYMLLRPFFKPLKEKASSGFLDESNWAFVGTEGMTSDLHGASPGHGQELSDELHPHLELKKTMVHVPEIRPGDFVAWHCDTIHAVDPVHLGKSDSSVLYIPVCPVTDINTEYLVRQRAAFRDGTPGPDFPGGEGEARHSGRPTEEVMRGLTNGPGRQAFGLDKMPVRNDALPGEREVVARANVALGF